MARNHPQSRRHRAKPVRPLTPERAQPNITAQSATMPDANWKARCNFRASDRFQRKMVLKVLRRKVHEILRWIVAFFGKKPPIKRKKRDLPNIYPMW
jgi:hypothetical protein